MELVWSTSPGLTIALAVLTVIAGILPASVAYVGSLIVDAVVGTIAHRGAVAHVVELVALEALLVRRTPLLPPNAACRYVSRCCARSWGSG